MKPKPPVDGFVAPGFEEVREEFSRNFTERGELGAACCVVLQGKTVVDLWGGVRDAKTGDLWERDTAVLVYSTTKGMCALALALAHSRGWLDYDRPVADYWPEFAQGGKEAITVRQLLSQQAGLSKIGQRLDQETVAEPNRIEPIIARQAPAWTPGDYHGYHALSLGWYENAILRRVDPKKRTLSQFFREEIAKPLDLDFHIKLPNDFPQDRLAKIRSPGLLPFLFHPRGLPLRTMLSGAWPWSLVRQSFSNPPILAAAQIDSPKWRAIELPSAGGIGTARALATAYSEAATGGKRIGLKKETLSLLQAPATPPRRGDRDLVLGFEISFALGFIKPGRLLTFGSSTRSFGFGGTGGSQAFADPDAGVGFSYVMNQLGIHRYDDPRDKSLRDALYRCLG